MIKYLIKSFFGFIALLVQTLCLKWVSVPANIIRIHFIYHTTNYNIDKNQIKEDNFKSLFLSIKPLVIMKRNLEQKFTALFSAEKRNKGNLQEIFSALQPQNFRTLVFLSKRAQCQLNYLNTQIWAWGKYALIQYIKLTRLHLI